MNIRTQRSQGFTIIELVVVIVILCILGVLVALTYSGVQAGNRDRQRQADIDILQSQLETYYARNDRYPSLAQINDATWRAENMKDLAEDKLTDPSWAAKSLCTANDRVILADQPVENCYSYQITASDGSACDNASAICGRYTLTATLENGETYVKASLN